MCINFFKKKNNELKKRPKDPITNGIAGLEHSRILGVSAMQRKEHQEVMS